MALVIAINYRVMSIFLGGERCGGCSMVHELEVFLGKQATFHVLYRVDHKTSMWVYDFLYT